jgi:acetolactate synthase-1/2/3 large subunit
MDTTTKAIRTLETTIKASKELTGAQMIVEVLRERNVEKIFGYPGGAVLPLYDALERSDIEHALVSHEQGAVHAADGYARSTGKTGVVTVTSGPGATNTVTGIQTAYSDSSPIVVITGQVPTSLLGTNAFQECDITNITKPCTKRNYRIESVKDLAETLREAFFVAESGRPGPVLVDIPKDIQLAKGLFFAPEKQMCTKRKMPDAAKIERAIAMMTEARQPVFYTGGGVNRSGPEASEALRELVAETGFPVTSTLMGLGAYPASGPQWLGMLGMHGRYEANMAMHEADLIVCIGARFDDRATGDLKGFAPRAKIIHIDIDPSSISKLVPAHLGIEADCASATAALLSSWRKEAGKGQDLGAWWNQIQAWRDKDSLAYRNSEVTTQPQYVLEILNELLKGKDAYIVTDVGQNQMWSAQYLEIEQPNHLVTSGGLGTMGFGLPAALGVKAAHPEAEVICICGDGGLQMTSPEMATAMAEGLPVKVLLLNNGGLGMVRQWNDITYKNRYSPSTSKAQPDFTKLAQAYGWQGLTSESPADVRVQLQKLLNTVGPCILNCRIDPNANCLPMTRPGGKGHHDMLFGPELS